MPFVLPACTAHSESNPSYALLQFRPTLKHFIFSDRRTPEVIVRFSISISYGWAILVVEKKIRAKNDWKSYPSFISFCQQPFSIPQRGFITVRPTRAFCLTQERVEKWFRGLLFRHFDMVAEFNF